jgi:hypothetical protein
VTVRTVWCNLRVFPSEITLYITCCVVEISEDVGTHFNILHETNGM